jgi:G3E family GTPase
MIPICLLTGFLGSGKTTLLEYLSAVYKSRRIVYVINEFSSLDVDGPRIRESGIEAISLPGGSIFCKCLVSDFIKTLKEIPAIFGNSESIDGVIITTRSLKGASGR